MLRVMMTTPIAGTLTDGEQSCCDLNPSDVPPKMAAVLSGPGPTRRGIVGGVTHVRRLEDGVALSVDAWRQPSWDAESDKDWPRGRQKPDLQGSSGTLLRRTCRIGIPVQQQSTRRCDNAPRQSPQKRWPPGTERPFGQVGISNRPSTSPA